MKTMVRRGWWIAMIVGAMMALGSGQVRGGDSPDKRLEAAETAFAATMANRDLEAFSALLDDEVVFFSGTVELRGAEAVAEAWAKFFDGLAAPFSWRPEVVSVLDSGTLGLTSGPVLNSEGERVGTFNSIWRVDDGGDWKIIFDRGCP